MLFDATGLEGNLRAVVECLDCKEEEGCAQDHHEVPIETYLEMVKSIEGETVDTVLLKLLKISSEGN